MVPAPNSIKGTADRVIMVHNSSMVMDHAVVISRTAGILMDKAPSNNIRMKRTVKSNLKAVIRMAPRVTNHRNHIRAIRLITEADTRNHQPTRPLTSLKLEDGQ